MILDPVVTDGMADVGMHVKVRSPRHIEEIAKKAKVSVDYAQEQVNKLADCGIVRCIYDGDVETYYYPIWVPGIMEGMLSVKRQVEKYPVIGRVLRALHPLPHADTCAQFPGRHGADARHARGQRD